MSDRIIQKSSSFVAKENVENVPKGDLNKQANYPEWMRMVTRRRFPYFPQLGDLVVYLQQGHKAYLTELKRKNIQVPPKFKFPSHLAHLDAEEVCYIDAIDYETIGKSTEKIHVARLQLSRAKNGKRIGQSFQICYHDMPNEFLDFIILKQHYDASLAMQLKPGDRVESIYDDEFHTGVIKRNPYEEEYPKSEWLSVYIRWDNGARDERSPWDLQRCAPDRESGIPATMEDHAKLGKYNATPEEWPVPQERAESAESASHLYQDRVLSAINQLTQLDDVTPFREAVDLRFARCKNMDAVNFARYKKFVDCVDYPIDLRTIEERIHNGFYRRSISILHDIQFLAKNAKTFNDPIAGAPVIRSACLLVETMFQFMKNWEEEDAIALFNRLKSSNSPLDCWKMAINPAVDGNAANSSMALPEPQQPALLETRNWNKELAGQSKAASLWAMECREMIEQLTRTFNSYQISSKDMSDLGYTFLADFRAIHAQLFAQCETPDKFLEGLRQFISEQISNVLKKKTRRSNVYHAIHRMEFQLEREQQSILANYQRKLLEEQSEREEAQQSGRQLRTAAFTARATWRKSGPEFSVPTADKSVRMAPNEEPNKRKRKFNATESELGGSKRKPEEPKVGRRTSNTRAQRLEVEPEFSAATPNDENADNELVNKAELSELRACKHRLEEMEPEFQTNKRKLDEAELKIQNDAIKLKEAEAKFQAKKHQLEEMEPEFQADKRRLEELEVEKQNDAKKLKETEAKLKEAESKFQANKRKLDEAELKIQNDEKQLREAEANLEKHKKKLERFEALKGFVDAGIQFQLGGPKRETIKFTAKRATIPLALSDFTNLAANQNGFEISSGTMELFGFQWILCATRCANGAWMELFLNVSPPEYYKGQFEFDVGISFHLNHASDLANDIRKGMPSIKMKKAHTLELKQAELASKLRTDGKGSAGILDFAEIEVLRDPKNGFLQEDGSVQVEVQLMVKAVKLDQFLVVDEEEEESGDREN